MRRDEADQRLDQLRVAAQAADHLDQPHQRRRIEEMQAADARRAGRSRRRFRSPRATRCWWRSPRRARCAFPARATARAWRQVLDDRFDDNAGRLASSSEPIARRRPARRVWLPLPCGLSPPGRRAPCRSPPPPRPPRRRAHRTAASLMPACAQTCAMPRPMVPAPITATTRSGRCRSRATLTFLRMSVCASPGTRACLPSDHGWRIAATAPCARASARFRAAR